jgi:hypothetical protein
MVGLVLAFVPWGAIVVASLLALPCQGAATAAIRTLCAAAVVAAILCSSAGLLMGEESVAPVASLVLAGTFGVAVLRSDPPGTVARMFVAGTMILAVTFWGQAAALGADTASPVFAVVRAWLLPALTLFLAGFAVHLRARVVPSLCAVMQRVGVFEPELYHAIRRVPVTVVRVGAMCLAVLAVVHHDSWFRSALLLGVAVAIDIALILAVLSGLSRLRRAFSEPPAAPPVPGVGG